MSESGSNRFEQLLASALELPADKQRAYIEDRADDDPELGRKLIALLAKEADLGDFLERPAVVVLKLSSGEPDRPGSTGRAE